MSKGQPGNVRDRAVTKRRLLVIVLAAAMVFVLLVGTVGYARFVDYVTQRDMVSLLSEAFNQGQALLEGKINAEFERLEGIARAIGVGTFLDSEQVGQLLEAENQGLRMVLADAQGNAFTSDGLHTDLSQDPVFAATMQGERVVTSVIRTLVGEDKRIIALSAPVYRQNSVTGTLTAVLEVEALEQTMQSLRGQGRMEYYLLQRDGVLIAKAQQGGVFSFAPDQDFTQEGHPLRSQLPGAADAIAAGQPFQKRFRAPAGATYYAYSAPLQLGQWALVCVAPQSVAASRVGDLTGIVILTIAVMALISLALLFIILLQRRWQDSQIVYMAYHDSRTGMENWESLLSRWDKMDENKAGYCLVRLRLDNLGQIFDIFSLSAGEQTLKRLASLLNGFVQPNEYTCHVQENDFALLLCEAGREQIQRRLKALSAQLDRLLVTDGNISYAFRCVFSLGAYPLEGKEKSLAGAREKAEMAMRAVRHDRHIPYVLFDQGMQQKLLLRNDLSADVQHALRQRQFIPYFQPKYDLATGKIVGAEVLARWQHPKRGLLMPGEFLPVLERNGLALELDLYMLEEACKKIREWTQREMMPVPLSVNMSRLNIHKADFVQRVIETVRKDDTPACLIELEITESAIYGDSGDLQAVMEALREEGFLLSIDDFGSGYSSLNMLQETPVDVLKLDQKFMEKRMQTGRARVILQNVLRMARELGTKVIAEGVETKEQEQFLKSIGCDFAQGYLYAHPVPNDEFEQLIF